MRPYDLPVSQRRYLRVQERHRHPSDRRSSRPCRLGLAGFERQDVGELADALRPDEAERQTSVLHALDDEREGDAEDLSGLLRNEIVVERAFNHPCNCGARLRICKDDCRPFPLMPSLDVLAVHEVPVQAS